ncbi:MAG: SpoIIE family protein phosphatase [Phycisphaerae bacterium]
MKVSVGIILRYQYPVLLLFLATGLVSWVFDSALDAFVLNRGAFAERLLLPSAHEIYMRSIIIACFLALGFFVANLMERRKLSADKTAHLKVVLDGIRKVEQDVARGGTHQEMIDRVCDDLVRSGAYRSVWIALIHEPDGRKLWAQAGMDGRFEPVAESIQHEHYPKCMAAALNQEQVLVLEGPSHKCPGCPLAPIYRGNGSLSIRLERGETVYGVMTASLPAHLAIEGEEQAMFGEVAADVATALHYLTVDQASRKAESALAQAHRREAETGFRIQQMLLFQRPPEDIPNAAIAAITIPSQQVDGDFYDFFKHNDQCFDVIIADVMGKGTHAALLGAATKSNFLRAIGTLMSSSLGSHLPQPRDIVAYVHREMTQRLIELESFVTAYYARFDLSQGRMTYVDCGHPRPIIFRGATGECELVEGRNLFLGADEQEVYEQTTVKVGPGDMILFYSDGVIEASTRQREFYGMNRLTELVRANGPLEPVQIIDKIVMDIISFATSEGPTDDLTCVAVKVKALTPSPPLARVELDLTSDPAELARIRGFVLGLSRRLPVVIVDEQDISRLELAVNEAATNIMRHAYGGRPDKRIRLEADIHADRLVIRLYHWGVPYDPKKAPPDKKPEMQTSGFGLSIIAQCVDEVRYLTGRNGSHCVELTKFIVKS